MVNEADDTIYVAGKTTKSNRVSRRGVYGTKLHQKPQDEDKKDGKVTPTPSGSPGSSVVPKLNPDKKKVSASASPTPSVGSKGVVGTASPSPSLANKKGKKGNNGAGVPEYTPEESVAPSVAPPVPNAPSAPGG